MEFVLEVINNLVYFTCVIEVGELFLAYKCKNVKQLREILITISFISAVLTLYVSDMWIIAIAHVASVLLVERVCFQENWKQVLGLYIGSTMVLSILSLLFSIISTEVMLFFAIEQSKNTSRVVNLLIILVCIHVIGKYYKERYKDGLKNIGLRYWLLFIIIMFFDAAVVAVFGDFILNSLEASRKYVIIFSYCCVVIGLLIQLVLLINTLVTRNVTKKTIIKILVITMLVALGEGASSGVAYAYEIEETEYEKAVIILKNKYGMDDFLISKLGENDVVEIAKQVSEDPNCLEFQKSTNVIDNIESVENAVNLNEEQLSELCGLDESTVKQIKANVEKQRTLTDRELKKEYGLSDVEIIIFRKALVEQENYVPAKACEREITLSSTISSSYLDFYDIVLNQCEGNKVQYHITVSFNWLKPCWNSLFEDTIAVAWGGNLSYKSGTVSKEVDYMNFTGVFSG